MNKKALVTIFFIVLTEMIGFGLVIPILPQIANKFSVSGTALGFLLASYSLAQFVAAPILGALSDKYGRKPVLVVSQIGTVISFVVLALSQSYWPFLLARLLDGFTGGNVATARAYIADATSKEDRSRGMALIGMAFGFGFIIGPAIGGFLYGFGDSHFVPAVVSGILSFVALLLTIVFLKEIRVVKSSTKKVSSSLSFDFSSFFALFSRKEVIAIILVQALYSLVFSGFESTFSIFTHESYGYSESQNSFLFMYIGIMILVIQGSLSRFRFKNFRFMARLGVFFTALGFLCIGFTSSLYLLYVGLLFISIGSGFTAVFLPSLLSTSDEDDPEGEIMGWYEGFGSLMRVFGPLVSATLIHSYVRETYGAFVVIMVFAGMMFLGKKWFVNKKK